MKNNGRGFRDGGFRPTDLTKAGIIAALYVALTGVSAMFGLSSGAVQVRISEALCVLPVFTPTAVPGLWFGCMLANLLFGGTLWDILFGSLATLLGALGAYLLRRAKYLAPLPTIAANTLIIPSVLMLSGLVPKEGFMLCAMTVLVGEIISAGALGAVLLTVISRHPPLEKRISGRK